MAAHGSRQKYIAGTRCILAMVESYPGVFNGCIFDIYVCGFGDCLIFSVVIVNQ